MKAHCPHCMNTVIIPEVEQAEETPCPACGSAISTISTEETIDWRLPSDKRSVGRFRLVERLGIGAFGTVYLAEDPELQRKVAIKVPRTSDLASSDDIELFQHEARSVSRLIHPGIVQVYESGSLDGMPYIVCEYVRGTTLADRLTGIRFSPRQSAEIVARVADALQYAHEQGVIHRDIKPGNIMLEADGTPRVMDFGLAKRERGEATITSKGQVLGTPAYMSPEQAAGHSHDVDGRSDVYSLGVVLYVLLTNEPPFRGNQRMLVHQVLHEDPRPPRALNDRVPADLETITLKAMHKEAGKRYQTAREFADDLRRWLDHAPILARPATRFERVWRWCRRHSALAALLATIALLLLTISVVSTGIALWMDRLVNREMELRARAESERIRAEALAQENNRRLVQLHIADGLRLADQGDTAGALVWLGEAMRLDRTDDQSPDTLNREKMHRIRFGALWRSSPKFSSLFFHDRAVLHAEFSADGRRLATASDDHTARVWDVATGKPLSQPLRHKASVNYIAFSADGEFVVTASDDRTARVWGIDSGSISPPLVHQGKVLFAVFSPDGRHAATTSDDHSARVWDARSGEELLQLEHDGKVNMAQFSPDGTRLLTACDDATVRLWDVESGDAVHEPMRHGGAVRRARFNHLGTRIISASDDSTAQIWDASTGEPMSPPLAHGASVQDAVFNPDGLLVATASNDSTARIWSAETGRLVTGPLEHDKQVKIVRFSPDGQWLLTAGNTQSAHLWDVTTGRSLGPTLPHNEDITASEFSPDGRGVLTAGWGRTARIWDLHSHDGETQTLRHQLSVNDLAYNSDGTRLATASDDCTVIVWDTESGEAVMPPLEHPFSVRKVVFNSDGTMLLTACGESSRGEIRLWDGQGKLVRSIDAPSPSDIRFSPDDSKIVAALSAQEARIWETRSGRLIGTPLQHDDFVYRVAFSTTGDKVVTASFDKTASVWDAATGRRILSLKHIGRVDAAEFSPDGRWIATACSSVEEGGYAQVWDADSGKPVSQRMRHNSAYVFSVSFSRDGKRLLTASSDQTARIWDPTTGTQLTPALKHQAPVQFAAFDPGGRMVVTASWDSTARVWDAANGLPVTPPVRSDNWVLVAGFSPDSRYAATGSRDGTARLIDLQPVDHSVERLTTMAELLSARHLDESAGLNRLPAPILREKWAKLGERW